MKTLSCCAVLLLTAASAVADDTTRLWYKQPAAEWSQLSLEWLGGRATRVVLRPAVDGARRLRAPRGQQVAAVTAGGQAAW
jgi:hypothetical protein